MTVQYTLNGKIYNREDFCRIFTEIFIYWLKSSQHYGWYRHALIFTPSFENYNNLASSIPIFQVNTDITRHLGEMVLRTISWEKWYEHAKEREMPFNVDKVFKVYYNFRRFFLKHFIVKTYVVDDN